jgi:hypothetical protein
MKKSWLIPFGSAGLAGILIIAHPALVAAATVLGADDSARVATIRNLSIKEGTVSGELVNTSPRTLRDVQLLIRHTWLWKNEMSPGEDNVSEAIYYTVEGDIPAGGTKPFTYRPSQGPPSRPDGGYETSVSVAGYSELVPVK